MEQNKELFKVYELDFGDTNVLSESIKSLLGWIETDIQDMALDGELNYTITVKMMSREEINALPEWAYPPLTPPHDKLPQIRTHDFLNRRVRTLPTGK